MWARNLFGVLCRTAPTRTAFHDELPGRSLRAFTRIYSRTVTTESSVASNKKPYYVTTPIFYVNAAPHIGHLYTLVLADVYKRWRTVLGETDAQMLTGTDEHGIKIQKAAAAAGIETKVFCDLNYERFQQLVKAANINNDYFIRTTDADHKRAVEYAWRRLNHEGYIYEGKHEGWYSVGDETFFPESAVHLVLDPATGRKMMASMETGREVEWTSETNYHFKLSEFKDRLLKFYEENPNFVTPPRRMREVIQSVAGGLEDLSISRPTQRLNWGIRVPNDESQTIYVWIDALMNYATRAGYPFTPGKEGEKGWPPDLQVIGKDIMRFHCVYWPALLMALGLPLPKRILSHAHWTMSKKKMSKSEGNVVNPFFAIDRFGVDVVRFYLIHDGGITDDSSYENAYIHKRYTTGLQGSLGNLVSRILRGKRWSVARAVQRARDKQLPEFSDKDSSFLEHPSNLGAEVKKLMDSLNCRGALQLIMETVSKVSHRKHLQHFPPSNLLLFFILSDPLPLHRQMPISNIPPSGISSRKTRRWIEETQMPLSTSPWRPFESLLFSSNLICHKR